MEVVRDVDGACLTLERRKPIGLDRDDAVQILYNSFDNQRM
jgi:hypothetical protein